MVFALAMPALAQSPVTPKTAEPANAKAFTLSSAAIMSLDDTKAERFYARPFTATVTARRQRENGGVELDIHFPSTKGPDYTLMLTSNTGAGAKSLVGLDVSAFDTYKLKFTLLAADGSTTASPVLTAGALIGPTKANEGFLYRPVRISLPVDGGKVSDTGSFAPKTGVLGLYISLYGGQWAEGPHDVTVLVEPVEGATPLPK